MSLSLSNLIALSSKIKKPQQQHEQGQPIQSHGGGTRTQSSKRLQDDTVIPSNRKRLRTNSNSQESHLSFPSNYHHPHDNPETTAQQQQQQQQDGLDEDVASIESETMTRMMTTIMMNQAESQTANKSKMNLDETNLDSTIDAVGKKRKRNISHVPLEGISALYQLPSERIATEKETLQTLQTMLEPSFPPLFLAPTREELLQPRAKGQKPKRYRHSYGGGTTEDGQRNIRRKQVMETQEEARKRVLRRDRTVEWNRLAYRWKIRRFDYRKEPDIGQAVYRMAKRVLMEQYQTQQDKERQQQLLLLSQAKQSKSKTSDAGNLDNSRRGKVDQDEDEDDAVSVESVEDDLQKQLLHRLSQSQRRRDDEDQLEKDKEEEELRPFKERMDYWQYGYALPQTLEFNYRDRENLKSAIKKMEDLLPNVDQKTKTKNELTCVFSDLAVRKDHREPRFYFPLGRDLQARLQFVHHRQLHRMAARYLCGGSSGNAILENRMIRALLHKSDDEDYHAISRMNRKYMVLDMAREKGVDMNVYVQHQWKNGWQVAKLLGVHDHYNESSQFKGKSMDNSAIKDSRSVRRHNIWKDQQICRRKWTYEDIECLQPADMEGIQHHPEAADPMIRPTATPSDASVTVTNISVPNPVHSDETLAGLALAAVRPIKDKDGPRDEVDDSSEEAKSAFVRPTVAYVHIPGTCPPIPNFPLDATNVVFGPVDRHARYVHNVTLDETSHALTVSTLMSRLAAASDLEQRLSIYDQLYTFVRQYVDLHANNAYKRLPLVMRKTESDLPLVTYGNSILHCCSFLANGYPMRIKTKSELRPKEVDEDDLYSSDTESQDRGELLNTKEVATEIFEFCESRVGHNGLMRFPRIHLTFALARLCRMLPNSAAEILSRALDDDQHRTPIQLIRRMLQHLEDHGYLLDGQDTNHGDGIMQAGAVEYFLYEAVETFEECVRLDPVNADYHGWHIGGLAACLLICSGNQVGSGACLYPSGRKRHQNTLLQVQKDDDLPSHEKRCKLPRFDDVRRELVNAMKLLFHLAKHQKSPRASLAIVSLLEWRQVISLLLGRDLVQALGDIRLTHRYHISRWALHEPSSLIHDFVNRQDDEWLLLSFRAREVESDPGDIQRWRGFVAVLGPVGGWIRTEGDRLHKSHCPECMLLGEELFIDHEAQSKCRRQNRWWGTNREWWLSDFLYLPTPKEYSIKQESATTLAAWLEKSMPATLSPSIGSQFLDVTEEGDVEEKVNNVSWLSIERNPLDDDIDTLPSKDERSKTYDEKLPKTFLEVMGQSFELSHSFSFEPPQLTGPDALKLEIVCYKILIACHLQSVLQVEAHILDLLKGCQLGMIQGQVNTNGNQWKMILWLCSMGLNALQILRSSRAIIPAVTGKIGAR